VRHPLVASNPKGTTAAGDETEVPGLAYDRQGVWAGHSLKGEFPPDSDDIFDHDDPHKAEFFIEHEYYRKGSGTLRNHRNVDVGTRLNNTLFSDCPLTPYSVKMATPNADLSAVSVNVALDFLDRCAYRHMTLDVTRDTAF
jgi:hypothetical protein